MAFDNRNFYLKKVVKLYLKFLFQRNRPDLYQSVPPPVGVGLRPVGVRDEWPPYNGGDVVLRLTDPTLAPCFHQPVKDYFSQPHNRRLYASWRPHAGGWSFDGWQGRPGTTIRCIGKPFRDRDVNVTFSHLLPRSHPASDLDRREGLLPLFLQDPVG